MITGTERAPAPYPSTTANVDLLLARYGDRGRAYLDGLTRGDPLADAVVEHFARDGRPQRAMRAVRAVLADTDAVGLPEPVRALFADLERPPPWAGSGYLDDLAEALAHIGRYHRQSGIVLGAASLLIGYANSNASRPLQLTGRYVESAGMRTIEVASWLREATRPYGLRRDAPGFERTVRVRMIHALVRHHLATSPEWDHTAWGTPISQSHLAYTLTEFGLIPLRALAEIGAAYTPSEQAAYYRLWRLLGHLLGVEPALLPADEVDQRVLEQMHLLTRPPVEPFCRDLVVGINTEFLYPELELLLPPPLRPQAPHLVHALERTFLGDPIADDLAIPRSRLVGVTRHVGAGLGRLNGLLDRTGWLLEARTARGERYADRQEERLRQRYDVRHQMVDDSPATTPHPARP